MKDASATTGDHIENTLGPQNASKYTESLPSFRYYKKKFNINKTIMNRRGSMSFINYLRNFLRVLSCYEWARIPRSSEITYAICCDGVCRYR